MDLLESVRTAFEVLRRSPTIGLLFGAYPGDQVAGPSSIDCSVALALELLHGRLRHCTEDAVDLLVRQCAADE